MRRRLAVLCAVVLFASLGPSTSLATASGPEVRAFWEEPDTRGDEEFSPIDAWRVREPVAEDLVCREGECR